jgi:hypothetical protein
VGGVNVSPPGASLRESKSIRGVDPLRRGVLMRRGLEILLR